MTSSSPGRITIHRTRTRTRRLAGPLVGIAVVAVLCAQLLASAMDPSAARVRVGEPPHPQAERPAALGEADGAIPDGATAFDDDLPGVARLDPALLGALRRATTHAADEGVQILVDSGWRSPEYQQRLLDEAVLEHGSGARAARWVATPETSAHVSGDAVDIGPSAATDWLSRHGAEYGLCRTYDNEPWHYERRPEAADHGCPPMYADPTHDPRMRRR